MTTLQETTSGLIQRQGGNLLLIDVITPGIGSSGVYPPDVLEEAARSAVFPAGTHMYIDHPTVTERAERPERSLKDLAGVFTGNAWWDGSKVVAEVRTFDPWAPAIREMRDAIGVSIRAAGTVSGHDDEGRPIIGSLDEVHSVDFVTRAGRGGSIREILESATPPVPAVESLPGGLVANDLEQRIKQALPSESHLVDFTDDWVVTAQWQDGKRTLTQAPYTLAGQTITLGTPIEVARRITYDPINPTIFESQHVKENPVEITEADHKDLTEKAARLAAVEAELATARQERDTALEERDAAATAADETAIERVLAEAGVAFNPLETAGLRASITRTDTGRIDIPAFEATVTEAAKSRATRESAPRGLPPREMDPSADMSESEFHAALGIK